MGFPNKKLGLVVLTMILCLPLLVFGQETTGSIVGMVSDPSGSRVPGATVKVESAALNRTGTTDDAGAFRFAALPPGSYKVSATATGFSTSIAENIVVQLGKAVTVDFQVKVGQVSEQIVVTAENVSYVDTKESAIQTNMSSATLDAMPRGMNMSSLMKLAPAARQEANSGGFQIDGASGSENSFVIDGMEVSNFRTGTLNLNNNLPFQFVQEMSIKTSGFNAEFGGATGGVISVVTKSGSNDFHGGVEYNFELDNFVPNPRPTLNSFRSGTGSSFVQINEYLRHQKDNYAHHYPSFSFGGPMAKDRLWYFLSYAPQLFNETRTTNYYSPDPRTRTQTGSETYTRSRRQEYFQGRLDSNITNTLRVNGSYTWNPYIEEGLFPHNNINLGGAKPSVNFGGTTGTLTGNALTTQQGGRQNSANVATQAVWTPRNNIVTSFRYSRAFLNERLNSYMIPQQTRFRCVGLAPPSSAGCSVGMDTLPSGNSNRFFDVSTRNTFEGDMSWVTNFAGSHEFKFGYQYAKVANDVNSGYVPFGRIDLYYGYDMNDLTGRNDPITPTAIGAGQAIRFGTVGGAANVAQSIYIQDRWQPTRRLSINAGMRLEKEDLPSFNGLAPPINFGWGDKIVPRLGFAYDLTSNGKAKIFGSYGRFMDRLKFELPRGSFGGDFYRVDYFEISPANPRWDYYTLARVLGNNTDVMGGKCPITGGSGLSRCQYDYRIASNDPNATIFTGKVDPDMHPFTQTEFTVGYEQEFVKGYMFSARYSYKNVNWAIEDAGFPTADGSEAYIIGNPGSGLHAATAKQFGYAKTTTPERRYDAMELKLDRRFANNLGFNLAYTYSRLEGNYSGLASSDEAGRTSPGVNRFFDLPHLGFTGAGTPDNGRLATDRPHVFNAYGVYDFKWFGKIPNNNTQFSFFTTAQSGTPRTSFYTLYAASILYGRGNLGRTPMFSGTDFAITHQVRMGERYRFEFNVNVLNIFNQTSVMSRVDNPGAVNPSISTLKLPANITNEPQALNYVLTNGIIPNYEAFLADPANPQRKQTALNWDNAYQAPRSLRLGFRFMF